MRWRTGTRLLDWIRIRDQELNTLAFIVMGPTIAVLVLAILAVIWLGNLK